MPLLSLIHREPPPSPDQSARVAQTAPPLNALTVDVEDYYHVSAFESFVRREQWDEFEPRVEGSTEKILELLAAASVRATFFILGWIAERNPRLVRRIHAAGHEIACHGYWHRLIYQQTPAAFRQDLRRARAVLQDAAGVRVTAYRAPSFSITIDSLWALDVLIEEGFLFDSSVYPTYHDRYGLPGAPSRPHTIRRASGAIHEFPMPVCRKFGYPLPVGGGGYFRLYPYLFTRAALRGLNRSGQPFAFYVHPWEVDPAQPRLPVRGVRRFRHYVGLKRTQGRLARLLADFRLGTLSEAFAALDMSGEMMTWELPAAA